MKVWAIHRNPEATISFERLSRATIVNADNAAVVPSSPRRSYDRIRSRVTQAWSISCNIWK